MDDPNLLAEVWDQLVSLALLTEDNLENLLVYRTVCRDWKALVDKQPPPTTWNPWLAGVSHSYHNAPATQLHKPDDVSNFLRELAQSPDKDANPFRNKTLSLFRGHQNINKFEQEILKILEAHGHHVWKLIYNTCWHLPVTLKRVPYLLSLTPNIKTLVIHVNPQYGRKHFGQGYPKLESLQELMVVGDWKAILTRKFCVAYGRQIKSLTLIKLQLVTSRYSIFRQLPNLKDLKIESLSLLERIPKRIAWPKLRRLAVHICIQCKSSILEFNNARKFIGFFSKTLESLSLKWDLHDFHHTRNELYPIIFKKLGKLIIPYSFMKNGIKIQKHFGFICPNLKSVVLQDLDNHFKGREMDEDKLKQICGCFWQLLPESVETISLRMMRQNQDLQLDFPVIYVCSRGEQDAKEVCCTIA